MANERVQTNAASQVVRKLKAFRGDGSTRSALSPLKFMQRLAALAQRPGLHLIRTLDVLEHYAKLRTLVVPQEVPQEPEPVARETPLSACEPNFAQLRPVRMSWIKLLTQVFDLDLEHCPNCGGELKIIAAIPEQQVIDMMLAHLGLQARAPPRAPARSQALQAN